ncbi:MAG TPA: tRNA pseudouridine(55) synthase TruB [Flavobacteriales bacterium]|nr:tRNA pseudouridine(55) synthase TruB [Flavobacteriales bacterium]
MEPRGPNSDFVFTPDAGGLILVDKPMGWTSFDAVKKIRGAMRSIVRRRNFKIGHAGTLDPLASGLLIMAYGPFTKQLPFITGQEKIYTGTMTLGSTTPSYDRETEPVPSGPWEHLEEATIRTAFARFLGEVMQRPPLFSAKRHEGERAYWLARDDSRPNVEMPAARVLITSLDVIAIRGAEVDFEVHVSKGTYIRSLAHDIGQVLGCGAHLSALRRTAIGPYRVEDADAPEVWAQRVAPLPGRA